MKHLYRSAYLLLLLAASLCLACPCSAQKVTTVHSFGDGSVVSDGEAPYATLIQGSDGNLYGTTTAGGSTASSQSAGNGTIFEYNPTTKQVTILHSFGDGTVVNDGNAPSSGLIKASDGNLYGTTSFGGSTTSSKDIGNGTIYEYNTTTQQVSIVHSFGDGSVENDGKFPDTALFLASDGNLYGTTSAGGSTASSQTIGNGTMYEYNTTTQQLTILHSFGDGSVANDGEYPNAALIQASDGNLYSTTEGGGSAGGGTIYEYNTTTQQVSTRRSFGDGSVANDGEGPVALILASDGNFYGTTGGGGSAGYGTIYEYNTTTNLVSILHSFEDGSVANDGKEPRAALIQASDGNLYGMTPYGGPKVPTRPFGFGTIFEYNLTILQYSILHSFKDGTTNHDGEQPFAALILASDGNFYGTTTGGGSTAPGTGLGNGTIFSLALPPQITSLAPKQKPAGTGSFVLNVYGSFFNPTAVVHWNGSALPTSWVSSERLKVTVPASDMAIVGTANVKVTNPNGYISNIAVFTILPPVIKTVSLVPVSVFGGASSTGTVTLTAKTVADTAVTVTSSDPAATIPNPVVVPAGQSSTTFTIDTTPVATNTILSIKAALGTVTKSATLTVKPPTLKSLSVKPTSVVGGSQTSTLTITLTGNAPAGGISVGLASSDPTTLPLTNATVPGGSSSVPVTLSPHAVTASDPITITATLGTGTKKATLTVTP